MGFSSALQGRAAHEALISRQDAELRLMETMKRCLSQKAKCDKEYAVALAAVAQQGTKVDRTDDWQGSHMIKAWRSIMEDWEQTSKQLKANAELLESVCQDKLTHLYQDKRKARKLYQEEHIKIAAQFNHLTEEVARKKTDYQKHLEYYKVLRSKFEEHYIKCGRGGRKLDDVRDKYQKACRKLHLAHNEYVLLISEAIEVEQDFRTILLPGLLEHQQSIQEGFITSWKHIIYDAMQHTDLTSDKFKEIQRRIESNLQNVNPGEEYREFTEKHKTSPATPVIFQFDQTLIEDKDTLGKLQPNTLTVDNLTIDWLRSRLNDLENSVKDCQEKQTKLITDSGRSTPLITTSPPILNGSNGITKDINKHTKDLNTLRCQERQMLKLADMIKTALNEVGCEELPSGCDDLSVDTGFIENNDSTDQLAAHSSSYLFQKGAVVMTMIKAPFKRKTYPATPPKGTPLTVRASSATRSISLGSSSVNSLLELRNSNNNIESTTNIYTEIDVVNNLILCEINKNNNFDSNFDKNSIDSVISNRFCLSLPKSVSSSVDTSTSNQLLNDSKNNLLHLEDEQAMCRVDAGDPSNSSTSSLFDKQFDKIDKLNKTLDEKFIRNLRVDNLDSTINVQDKCGDTNNTEEINNKLVDLTENKLQCRVLEIEMKKQGGSKINTINSCREIINNNDDDDDENVIQTKEEVFENVTINEEEIQIVQNDHEQINKTEKNKRSIPFSLLNTFKDLKYLKRKQSATDNNNSKEIMDQDDDEIFEIVNVPKIQFSFKKATSENNNDYVNKNIINDSIDNKDLNSKTTKSIADRSFAISTEDVDDCSSNNNNTSKNTNDKTSIKSKSKQENKLKQNLKSKLKFKFKFPIKNSSSIVCRQCSKRQKIPPNKSVFDFNKEFNTNELFEPEFCICESSDDGLFFNDHNYCDPKSMTLSTNRPLYEEEWFHGVLPREEVVRLLKNDGDYLVRETTRNDEIQIVLSVCWNGHKHFIVQTTVDGHYRFEGPAFPSIQELILHQHQSELPVTGRSGAVLRKPAMRERWELCNDDVILLDKIGKGNFGDVYKAKLKSSKKEVAVKTCRMTLPDEQKRKFLQEGRILKQYDHPNIVKLIGICVQKQPIMIVMELVPGGSLLNFLRKNSITLNTKQLLGMCRDAAAGMRYLESKSCIHRDLAARNCLIGYENCVKISDFGMSREEEEYIVSDGMKQIPIKWTAPEALNFGKYTSLCDVWSYGILMWEIFSKGDTPYSGMSNTRARERIDTGYRMPPPENTPPDMYKLMLKTWLYEPEQRPHFDEIYTIVETIMNREF